MGQAAMKVYKADSDATNVYRNATGMDIAKLDTATVLGNYADLMKNNIVILTELTIVDQTVLPISLPGDDNY
jgi:hypothetical protein